MCQRVIGKVPTDVADSEFREETAVVEPLVLEVRNSKLLGLQLEKHVFFFMLRV